MEVACAFIYLVCVNVKWLSVRISVKVHTEGEYIAYSTCVIECVCKCLCGCIDVLIVWLLGQHGNRICLRFR